MTDNLIPMYLPEGFDMSKEFTITFGQYKNLSDKVVTIQQHNAQLATEMTQVVIQRNEGLEREQKLIEEVKRLKQQLAEQPKPDTPAPEQPQGEFTPVISRDRFENLIIGSIVKGGDAGTEDKMVREAIDQAVEVGCNSVTFWIHPSEAAAYLKPENINDPMKNIFKYAADRGVIIGADTVDAALRIIKQTPDDGVFNRYIDNLIALGARYILWNDVDGRDEKNGERIYSPAVIKTGMGRLKRALQEHPQIPIIASLTAGAALDMYKQEFGFNFVEIQTFGSLAELANFVELEADALCIDTQQSASLSYLRDARFLIVQSDISVIRLYAIFDEGTDFRSDRMATRIVEVKETTRQFKETRIKRTA